MAAAALLAVMGCDPDELAPSADPETSLGLGDALGAMRLEAI